MCSRGCILNFLPVRRYGNAKEEVVMALVSHNRMVPTK